MWLNEMMIELSEPMHRGNFWIGTNHAYGISYKFVPIAEPRPSTTSVYDHLLGEDIL